MRVGLSREAVGEKGVRVEVLQADLSREAFRDSWSIRWDRKEMFCQALTWQVGYANAVDSLVFDCSQGGPSFG